jgi:late competence protein required for DNA uptake (superfamily II DNA/RNA helicase)
MIKKKNQCRNCNNVILSQDSKLSGRCFYCRNYTKIQRLRMIEHDSMMEKMEKMPTNTNIQRYEKRKIREELLFGRQTFVKFGRVEKPTKYKEQEKLDLVAINLAIRDPETEKRIVWAKLNKGMLR